MHMTLFYLPDFAVTYWKQIGLHEFVAPLEVAVPVTIEFGLPTAGCLTAGGSCRRAKWF